MFRVGENIKITKEFIGIKPKYNKVRMLAPARLHLTIMDPSYMKIGELGGGGIGVALNLNNIIEMETIEGDEDIIENTKKAVIQHLLIVIRKIFNTNIHFKINIKLDERMKEHCGLAWNAMISNAIIYGVNYIFGSPLSKKEIVEILDNNFVEEKEQMLVRDICTGIAHNVCCFGGLCIVSNEGKLINKYNMPEDYRAIIIKTEKNNNCSNIETEINILKLLQKYDLENSYKKAYTIINEIIPALNENNIEKLIKCNNEFHNYESYKKILDYYNVKNQTAKEIIDIFKSIPNIMYGLSTNAKYVYLITKEPKDIIDICTKNEINYDIYSINNNGVNII